MINFINTDPYLLFAGCFCLVLGLSTFFAPNAWNEYINLLSKSKALILMGGIFTLPIGLFIVMFYKNWAAGPAEMILMLVGALSLLKAILLLAKPDLVQKILTERKGLFKNLQVFGTVGIVFGIAMLVL